MNQREARPQNSMARSCNAESEAFATCKRELLRRAACAFCKIVAVIVQLSCCFSVVHPGQCNSCSSSLNSCNPTKGNLKAECFQNTTAVPFELKVLTRCQPTSLQHQLKVDLDTAQRHVGCVRGFAVPQLHSSTISPKQAKQLWTTWPHLQEIILSGHTILTAFSYDSQLSPDLFLHCSCLLQGCFSHCLHK